MIKKLVILVLFLLVIGLVSAEKVIVVVNEENFLGFDLNSEEKVLEDVEFEKENDFEELNAFSGEVNEENLEKLKEKNVEVYEDRIFGVFLEDSVNQVNASKVWDLNITGKDEGVCIIDTGINYLHESFGCSQDEYDKEECRIFGYDYVNDDSDVIDDAGHGTHVSGIVGANGDVKGIAPDVNLVIIKACDSSGSCYESDVISGINFCRDNKDKYNISVISMSLGAGVFTSLNCPAYGLLENVMGLAYDEGIFIVASSGNDGDSNGIAYPACSPNVTAVGAVNKGDNLANFGNRGNFLYKESDRNLLRLLAPGVGIVSTWLSDSRGLSGTSMSAPFVGAAVALLRDYKTYEGKEISNLELENVLNDTGKGIYDKKSNFTFSRIDVYSALIEIDTKKPVLDVRKEPVVVNVKDNVSFIYEVEEINLKRVWLEVKSNELNGNFSNFIFNNFSVNESVSWKFYAEDLKGNIGNSSLENFIVGNNLGPVIVSYEPNESVNVNENKSLNFLIEVSDWNNDSLSYSWYLDGSNISNEVNLSYYFDFDSEGNYNFSVVVSDGELNDSVNWIVNVSNVNRAPVLEISDLIGVVGEWFNYSLNGSDLDGDSLSFSSDKDFFVINGSEVLFLVENIISGLVNVSVSDGLLVDSEVVSFNVTNRPLISYEPDLDVSVNEGNVDFKIIVSDLDNDSLSYSWYLDSLNVSYEQNYSHSFSEGSYNVSVFVSDGFLIEKVEWDVKVSKVVSSGGSSGSSGGGGGGSRGGSSSDESFVSVPVVPSVPSFVVDTVEESSNEGNSITGKFVKGLRDRKNYMAGLILLFLGVVGYVIFRMKSHVKV